MGDYDGFDVPHAEPYASQLSDQGGEGLTEEHSGIDNRHRGVEQHVAVDGSHGKRRRQLEREGRLGQVIYERNEWLMHGDHLLL